MAGYGENFTYGMSDYKDGGSSYLVAGSVVPIEPIIMVTFENRAYVFSHRKDSLDRREYRITEFMKRGQYTDKFMFGD